jgi:hypothetical protein
VLKAALNLRRFLLRGISGVQQEWLWGWGLPALKTATSDVLKEFLECLDRHQK